MAICTGPEAIKIILNVEHQLDHLSRLQQAISNNNSEKVQVALKEVRDMAHEIDRSANEILDAERSSNPLNSSSRT